VTPTPIQARAIPQLLDGKDLIGQARTGSGKTLDRGFARDVEQILAHSPRKRQTALFSATLPAWVAGIAARHVRDAVTIEVDAGTSAPPEIEFVV
jgi:superfamily II DNA/RNA helicase